MTSFGTPETSNGTPETALTYCQLLAPSKGRVCRSTASGTLHNITVTVSVIVADFVGAYAWVRIHGCVRLVTAIIEGAYRNEINETVSFVLSIV